MEQGRVVHSTFGTGVIGRIGEYKGTPTVWIDFDAGMRKALSIEHGLPHLRPEQAGERRTASLPDERCDYCGSRPVVVSLLDGDVTGRCCDDHREQLSLDYRGEPPSVHGPEVRFRRLRARFRKG